MFDGVFFAYNQTYDRVAVNTNEPRDMIFCASRKHFNATMNSEPIISLDGNFTFFSNLNVWSIISKSWNANLLAAFNVGRQFLDFTGCISRLRIGASFPLKNPTSSRLSYGGGLKFGACPLDPMFVASGAEERKSDRRPPGLQSIQRRD